MKNTIWLLLFILFIGISCHEDNDKFFPDPNTGIIYTDLIKLEDAADHSDTNFANLINKVRGSVGTIGPASKVIWSKKNDYSLGLYISANHVYGINTWNSRSESYIDISSTNNGIFLGSQLPPINGDVELDNILVAFFGLYHPDISNTATNTTILPEEDFYLGIVDNQKIIDNGLGAYPERVMTDVPLEMYDPYERTISTQTWAQAQSGDLALVVGYPQDRENYPNGAVSTGEVLTDTEAELVIEQLKEAGDEEGSIPYNSQVEFIAKARAVAGMSGGGVFNYNGQLLGISVRSTTLNDIPILRVVKITYIKDKLSSFYDNLSLADKNKIYPFISGEL